MSDKGWLSASNILQQDANEIERQRLKVEKRANIINTVAAIAAIVAAVAAVLAAVAAFSSKETIELFIDTTNVIDRGAK